MASAILDLGRILKQNKAANGVVVSISAGVAKIATSDGMVQAKANASVVVGSRVRVTDGWATLTVLATRVYPV